jgi:uncharacterized membrane protein YeaQ/YmgE (transglycosylase-associated protein family)
LANGFPEMFLVVLIDQFMEVEMIHLLILLVVGAVVGLTAERITERSMPYGWIGSIAAGLLGAWLMVDILHIGIAPQLLVADIPLLSAIAGAIIVVVVWSVVTGSGRLGYGHARIH